MVNNDLYYFPLFRRLFDLSHSLIPVRVGHDAYFLSKDTGAYFYFEDEKILTVEMGVPIEARNPPRSNIFLNGLFALCDMDSLKGRMGARGNTIVSYTQAGALLPVDLCVVRHPFSRQYIYEYLKTAHKDRKEPVFSLSEIRHLRFKGGDDFTDYMHAILENIAKNDWIKDKPLSFKEDDFETLDVRS